MFKHISGWVVNNFFLMIDDPINLFRDNIYFPFNTLYLFAQGNGNVSSKVIQKYLDQVLEFWCDI